MSEIKPMDKAPGVIAWLVAAFLVFVILGVVVGTFIANAG